MKTRLLTCVLLLGSMAGCNLRLDELNLGNAITGPSEPLGPTVEVTVSGVVTRGGQPLDSVRVGLGTCLASTIQPCAQGSTVYTDATGQYRVTLKSSLQHFCSNATTTFRAPPDYDYRFEAWFRVAGCGNQTVNHDFPKSHPVSVLSVTPSTIAVSIGATHQFTAVAMDAAGALLPDRAV